MNDRFLVGKGQGRKDLLEVLQGGLQAQHIAFIEDLFQVDALDILHDHDQDAVDDIHGQQLDDMRMVQQAGLQDRFLQQLVGLGGRCGGGSSTPAGISGSCPRPGTRCRNRRCPVSSDDLVFPDLPFQFNHFSERMAFGREKAPAHQLSVPCRKVPPVFPFRAVS